MQRRDEKIKGKLDEMELWAEANLEDLRSRGRNDGEEEQTRGCFKAKLRQWSSIEERRLYDTFIY